MSDGQPRSPDAPQPPAEDPLALAQAALQRRDAEAALRHAERRLQDAPGDVWAQVFRAAALHAGGQLEAAERALTALLEAAEGHRTTPAQTAAALRVQVSLRVDQGRTAEAIAGLQRAIELEPADEELRQWACALLCEAGRYAEAEAQIAALEPRRGRDPDFWSGCARVHVQAGNRGPAERAFRRALALDPMRPSRRLDLARFLAESGRTAEAIELLDRVLERDPGHAAAHSGRLVLRTYAADADPDALARAAGQAGQALGAGLRPLPPVACVGEPGRPLRVAYLSPDFRDHSCAQFAEPLFRAHDRGQVHLTLYYDQRERSARSAVFENLADRWRQVDGLGDEALAAQVRADGIDVLVEMAGHTGGRLRLLPLRPAPVQLAWLGWPFTTGLDCLDGRITDSRVDPPGNEAFGSEPLCRLDPTYLAWAPPPIAVPVGPGRPNRPFTFGSFNQLAKLNEGVVQAWAAILRRVPGSRLLLKGRGGSDPAARERLLEGFAEAGVPGRRIEFLDFAWSAGEHLAQYRELDLALDPFPYNGVTTTLEALWMEVPVLALEGRHSLARHGAALLGQVGRESLVCASVEAYIARAVGLAEDPQSLASARSGLREALLGSPLCDAEGLARRMEALFRDHWAAAQARAQANR